MREDNKETNEYAKISDIIPKSSKNHLSQIALYSKRNLDNSTIEEKAKSQNCQNIKINGLPPIRQQNLFSSSIYQFKNAQKNSRNNINYSNENFLQQLLSNSLDFEHYQRAVVELSNNQKNSLPITQKEERKEVVNKKMDFFLNEKSYRGSTKNFFKNSSLFSKNYSLCLNTLNQIKTNKRYNFIKLQELMKKKILKKDNIISKNNIMREIILNEYSYKDLYYEEQKIYKDYKYYNDFIKKRLLELKKETPPEEKVHRIFEKEYEHSQYSKPYLTFNSLSISFKCKGKNHFFHIPFEYLPLFYYKNMNYLKFILVSIFKFDNDFDNLFIDFDEIIYILSCSKQFEIKTEEQKKEEKDNNQVIPDMNYESLNMTTKLNNTLRAEKKTSSKKLSNLNKTMNQRSMFRRKTGSKKSQSKNNICNLSMPKIRKIVHEEIPEEEKNLYKCIYDKFVFKWNTPKYNYDITVKVPEAIFQVGKTVLKAYINIELIFYLLENNFKNWDFYISQYLFSYKECRRNMGELTSVRSMVDLHKKDLDSLPVIDNSSNRKAMNVKSKKKNPINNLNIEKIQQISEKSKTYEYIYTDEKNNNYVKIVHNFVVTSRCKSLNLKRKFVFDFNFYHMRILNKILRIQGLNFFLKKLIYMDKQDSVLKFRYDELCSLANEHYKILEKHDPNINGEQTCIRMKERSKDTINMTITFPVLETIKYNNHNYDNCFESDYDEVIFEGMPLEILDELCRNDFSEWPKILLPRHNMD